MRPTADDVPDRTVARGRPVGLRARRPVLRPAQVDRRPRARAATTDGRRVPRLLRGARRPRDASEEDIRRAYRKLARENHPDVNKDPGAEDRFKEISEAYEVLRDPEKRERYDRLGANWKAGQDVSGASGFGGSAAAVGGGNGGRARRVRRRRRLQRLLRGPVRRPRARPAAASASRLLDGAAATRRRCSSSRSRRPRAAGSAGSRSATAATTRSTSRRRARRPADPAGRRGRPAARRRPAGDLLPARPAPAAPALPGRRPRPLRRPPVAPWEAALGATVEVPTLDGSAQREGPAGLLLAAAGCGCAAGHARRRGARRPVRGGEDHGAEEALASEERELFEQLAETSKFDPRGSR